MATSMRAADRITPDQKVAKPYLSGLLGEAPRPSQVSAGNSADEQALQRLLAQAIDETGQRKAAATDMDISAPVLSKQLAGVDNASPSLRRASRLKPETLRRFGELVQQEYGGAVDPMAERRAAAEDAVRAIGRLVAVAVGE